MTPAKNRSSLRLLSLAAGAITIALVLSTVITPAAAAAPEQRALMVLLAIVTAIAFLLQEHVLRSQDQGHLRTSAPRPDDPQLANEQSGDVAAHVRFSQALNFCTDADALRRTVIAELPRLVGHQRFWVQSRGGGPEVVISAPVQTEILPHTPETWETFPLVVGGRNVGVLGVQHEAEGLTEKQRRTLELAALTLAGSVRNVQLFERINQFSMFDPLTGCLTKQQGIERLAAEMRRVHRTKTPLSLVLLEVDHLQALNLQYGPALGDQILARLGKLFKHEFRATDWRCRYGPGVFAFMLPDTAMEGALRAAMDLRHKVSQLTGVVPGDTVPVTASIGVTEVLPSDAEPFDCLRRAEKAVRKAVLEGRNCVAVADGTEARFAASH